MIPGGYAALIANNGSDDVTWTNGSQAFNLPAGPQPYAMASNPLTSHVYVANNGDGTITEFDFVTAYGLNDTSHTLTAGGNVQGLAVNPVTGQVWVADYDDDNVTIFTEEPFTDTRVSAGIDPLPGHITPSAEPVLTGMGVNRLNPNRNHMMGVAGYVNDMAYRLNWNQVTSGGGTDSISWSWNWANPYDSLLWGENYVCAVPFEMDAATTNNEGVGSPFVGNPVVYPVYRTLTTGVEEPRHTAFRTPQLALSVAPNPVNALSVVRYSLPTAGRVRLTLLDAVGRSVRVLASGYAGAGMHNVSFRNPQFATRLAPGVYFLKLDAGASSLSRKLIVE